LAHSRSAAKRARQAQKRFLHNRSQRSRMKTAIKRVFRAEEITEAETAFRQTSAMLDRYATRRLIHPNKASRKKSQMARRLAELRQKA
jgi:small subunit ribosomal protein S20